LEPETIAALLRAAALGRAGDQNDVASSAWSRTVASLAAALDLQRRHSDRPIGLATFAGELAGPEALLLLAQLFGGGVRFDGALLDEAAALVRARNADDVEVEQAALALLPDGADPSAMILEAIADDPRAARRLLTSGGGPGAVFGGALTTADYDHALARLVDTGRGELVYPSAVVGGMLERAVDDGRLASAADRDRMSRLVHDLWTAVASIPASAVSPAGRSVSASLGASGLVDVLFPIGHEEIDLLRAADDHRTELELGLLVAAAVRLGAAPPDELARRGSLISPADMNRAERAMLDEWLTELGTDGSVVGDVTSRAAAGFTHGYS
jgi:hypothetical protein